MDGDYYKYALFLDGKNGNHIVHSVWFWPTIDPNSSFIYVDTFCGGLINNGLIYERRMIGGHNSPVLTQNFERPNIYFLVFKGSQISLFWEIFGETQVAPFWTEYLNLKTQRQITAMIISNWHFGRKICQFCCCNIVTSGKWYSIRWFHLFLIPDFWEIVQICWTFFKFWESIEIWKF